jgi:hypothetical protein
MRALGRPNSKLNHQQATSRIVVPMTVVMMTAEGLPD